MVTVSIPAELRTAVGTKFAKADRKSGNIPAVIYGAKAEPMHIIVKLKDVKPVIYTPEFKIAEVNVEGKVVKCIIKDTQFHAVNDQLSHIDFLRLEDGHKVKIDVPVRFEGTSPGVKLGGKLIQSVRKVPLKTLPSAMVDEVKVNISSLELGGVLRVKNIELPEGNEIMLNPSIPIANVEIPRALKSAAAEEKKATPAKK